jgi:hypothetical protein
MADDDSTQNPRPITMRIDEIHSLADRLLNRGLTKLTNAEPEQQNDLRLAARVIRTLVRSFAPGDVLTLNGA